MIAAPTVTVVISGRRIESSDAAWLKGGTVVGPLDPFVRDIAERIENDGHRIVIARGARRIVLELGDANARRGDVASSLPVAPFARAGSTYVPLAAVVRALGGSVTYDAKSRTLAILVEPLPLASMTPSAGYLPPPGPLATFTPKPTPQPEVTVSGIPHPRRTPIEANPER